MSVTPVMGLVPPSPTQQVEECSDFDSIEPKKPSGLIRDSLNMITDFIQRLGDAEAAIYDGQKAICSVYSKNCYGPPTLINEITVDTPASMENTKIVVSKYSEDAADSQAPKTIARALSDGNLIEIDPVTQKTKTLELSDATKSILANSSTSFDPSGKSVKLTGLTEAQRTQMRQDFGSDALIENSQTGEFSVNLDRAFESSSADQSTPPIASANSLGSNTRFSARAIASPPSDFSGSPNLYDKDFCMMIERTQPPSSTLYQNCVRRGFITSPDQSMKALALTSLLDQDSLLPSNREHSTAKTSSPLSTFYPSPVNNSSMSSAENRALNRSENYNSDSSFNGPNASSSGEPIEGNLTTPSNQSSSFSLTSSQSSPMTGGDRADRTLEEMTSSLVNASSIAPTSQLPHDLSGLIQLAENSAQDAAAFSTNGGISSIFSPARSQALVTQFILENLSPRNESVNGITGIPSSQILEHRRQSQSSNATFEASTTSLDAQPSKTSKASSSPHSPSKVPDIEIPVFVLPDRPRFALQQLDSDEPPQI